MDHSTDSQIPHNLKNRLKRSYDAIAPAYNKWTTQHSSVRMEFLDQLISLIAPSQPSSILELGAGAGSPATEHLVYSLPLCHITANDISSTQISLGKANLAAKGVDERRVTWVEGDMSALSFADGSFDAALGLYSLIHLPRHEQRDMLTKLYRWLRPGGYLLANFAEMDVEGLVIERWLDQDDGWMFWSGLGAQETIAVVKKAGFEVTTDQIRSEEVDVSFLWVIARKPTS